MKKIISVILCFTIILCILPIQVEVSSAPSGTCGLSATWSINTLTKTLHISGSGRMKDYSGKDHPWFSYNDQIEHIEIAGGITHIGAYSFYEMGNTTSNTLACAKMEGIDYADQAKEPCARLTVFDAVPFYDNPCPGHRYFHKCFRKRNL